MLYLLDANVLIDANRDYYPMSRVPEFWSWLRHNAEKGFVKMPQEIYDEPKAGTDELADWLKRGQDGQILLLDEDMDISLIRTVVEQGYAADLNDEEILKIGRDPFLIAYALADPTNRRIVTTEASKPKAQRANRRVPDVCRDVGITSFNTFRFIRELNFSTSWNA